jgi:hypothetical protein
VLFLPVTSRTSYVFAQQQSSIAHKSTKMAELAHTLNLQQEANRATIRLHTTCDASYTCEYTKFVKWVKNQPTLATQEEPFLTRTNVDHYFSRVVSCRFGCLNSINRVVNALDWHAKNKEHVGKDPPFLCKSVAVTSALVTQAVFNNAGGGTGHRGSDPHLGLKDILPRSDFIRIMKYIYSVRNDWGPASISFTWGMNGAIRGASNRVLKYADINISSSFGPGREGEDTRAILLVHRKGLLHKDKHTTDKQVCVWRHVDYVLCSVLSTALHVIFSLMQNPDISFFHFDRDERADWWDTPLIDWEDYSGECARRFYCTY